MRLLLTGLLLITGLPNALGAGSAHTFHADGLLRYENETDQINLKDRERMRVIAHAGVKSNWTSIWKTQLRLSTGLKNKQNVPAITVHKFNDQPQPDSDVYVDRVFVQANLTSANVKAGKIPWGSKQITDIFWDRHLNPIGVDINYKMTPDINLYFAQFKPLDGEDGTVGNMSVLQWQHKLKLGNYSIDVMPWFVNYFGEDNATYAKKDTAVDNQFFRLSTSAKYSSWRLGLDWGMSLKSKSDLPLEEFNDQTNSYAVELRQGTLKKVGGTLTQLRTFRVERFAVVGEFAQNAVSRFATNNVQGWDLRIRHKMNKSWWIGTRLSITETIKGTKEEGNRFRIETKYSF